MGVVFHRPGAGENHAVGGFSLCLKATSDDTNGSFFLSESVLEPGFPGPPLHTHRELHDMFYVLEGTLTMQLEGKPVEVEPGSFVCVAPGTPHTFSNPSDRPVRILNFNTPGGWENYMRELATAFAQHSGPPPPEEVGAIASRYDFEVVGPSRED